MRWPRPTNSPCCGCGKAWGITAGQGSCTARRESSCGSTAGGSPVTGGPSTHCPASDATPPARSCRSLSTSGSRLLALRGDVAQSAGQRRLWALAETLLPRRDVGRFNQALMELGSQICTPREPRCDSCPVVTLCPTYSQGLQDVIPRPKPKPAVEDVQEAAVVVHRRRQVLLVRRGEGQRWAGLWDFPRFAVSAVLGPAALRRELAENVRLATGYVVEPRNHLATIKHGVTRFRITLQCHQSRYVRRDRSHPLPAEHRWLRIGQLEGYPLSVTGRKLARMLAERISDPLIRRGNYVHPVNGYNSSNAAEKAP